ncbi:unannotated protein [freshwater metagenome]|uniref:Unannotated protein n=1 Tax=freshwater metagenome TaxID=449393 RepID=A0A6J7PC80_9ZZZZ
MGIFSRGVEIETVHRNVELFDSVKALNQLGGPAPAVRIKIKNEHSLGTGSKSCTSCDYQTVNGAIPLAVLIPCVMQTARERAGIAGGYIVVSPTSEGFEGCIAKTASGGRYCCKQPLVPADAIRDSKIEW